MLINLSQSTDFLPVILVSPVTDPGETHVGVVEIAFGMEYLGWGQKVLANGFFPKDARLSSESCYSEN